MNLTREGRFFLNRAFVEALDGFADAGGDAGFFLVDVVGGEAEVVGDLFGGLEFDGGFPKGLPSRGLDLGFDEAAGLGEEFLHVELIPVGGIGSFGEGSGGDIGALGFGEEGIELRAGDGEEPVSEGADRFIELEGGEGLGEGAEDLLGHVF